MVMVAVSLLVPADTGSPLGWLLDAGHLFTVWLIADAIVLRLRDLGEPVRAARLAPIPARP
ncbi:hypothetical protein [Spongiactinospora sp. TRM90649]|uniref:hypothetical protein n=1 Tax=Spongiactinospora sp. TRM90649 TaxID=3031114 RepID=UPI0023F98F59|nr:hypothetical protein [Spongiactinospora sp. TRM90649]MDF5754926.1 hypothetical protein [Spongiactinospora sp. TRM90649]